MWGLESEVLGDVCSGFVNLKTRPRFYVGQAEVFGSQNLEELTRSGGSKTLLVTALLQISSRPYCFPSLEIMPRIREIIPKWPHTSV